MDKVTCPFCNDGNTSPYEDTKFILCGTCGLLINKYFPSKEELKERCRHQMLSTCFAKNPGESRIKNANKQLDVLEKYMKPGKVYDVAAAAGFFMKAALDRGWIPLGNEISVRAIKWASEHYRIAIQYGFLEELELDANYYDAIVLWNALEHMYNPRETLEICRDMLKVGGLIYIRVPDKSTIKELNEQYEPLHLYEFHSDGLAEHLENLGFKEIEIWPGCTPDSDVRHCDFLYRRKP